MPTYTQMLQMPHEYFKYWLCARSYGPFRVELLSEMVEYEEKTNNLNKQSPEVVKKLFLKDHALKVSNWINKLSQFTSSGQDDLLVEAILAKGATDYLSLHK